MILFTCDICGGTGLADEATAGHWATCPTHYQSYVIPFTGKKSSRLKPKNHPHFARSQGLFHFQGRYPPSWSTIAKNVISNDEQWQESTDPVDLLTCALQRSTPRQIRRFSTACARQVLERTALNESHRAVEVAERWSHGLVNDQELDQAEREAWAAWQKKGNEVDRAARSATLADIHESVFTTSLSVRTSLVHSQILAHCDRWEKEVYPDWLEQGQNSSPEEQEQLLREKQDWEQQIESQVYEEVETLMKNLMLDVFGNPFRLVHIPETWLGKHQNTVVSLARYIYQEQRFEEMPILGDALEDASCPVEEVLEHCREHPVHSRGCHVLEALLWPTAKD